MSASQKASRQWREKRFNRTFKKYDREMKPFSNLLDSKGGRLCGLCIYSMVFSFAVGQTKRSELDAALASASEASSIAFKTWNAVAQIAIEMVQLSNCTVGIVEGGRHD